MKTPRDIAKENSETTYFTGKPCRRGHISNRRTSNYICIQCASEIYNKSDRNNYRFGDTFYRQFCQRQQAAKQKDILFTISFEEIEQPEYCPVLGIKLNYGWSGLNRRDDAKATIDKVIPELGYVSGNVFVISWRANKLKSNMTLDELQKIMNYIKDKTNG
jgi:hypothetical protein